MDIETQHTLAELTTQFYQANADSFSATRSSSWQGWERVYELMSGPIGADKVCVHDECESSAKTSVFDVACGNMRFERFLLDKNDGKSLADTYVIYTIDNQEFAPSSGLGAAHLTSAKSDIISNLIDGKPGLQDACSEPHQNPFPACHVVCNFGFMHHIPGTENRQRFLKELVEHTCECGLTVVSLWRFMDVEQLQAKALTTLEAAKADENLPANLRAQLDELERDNDYLLGWQNITGSYRYCHSFDDAEINTLINYVAPDAKLVERFRADGKSENANEYLVFKKVR